MGTNPTVLLRDDDRHRIATGVKKFHDAGYYGERVIAASGESWALSQYNPGDLVYDPLGIGGEPGGDPHSIHTASTFFQVAPKAKLYMLYSSDGIWRGDGTYESKFLNKSTEIIEKVGITNMFVSLNFGTRHEEFFTDLATWMNRNPNFKFFWAAGNDSNKKSNAIMEVQEVIGVAAYTLMVDGTMNPAYYSSLSENVDFSAPSMIYTNINATKPTDSGYPNSGTSFSTPWLCGMSCLVDDFFLDKKGAPLTNAGMTQFFKDHCIDLRDPGFDTKTGWGAVVLPDPAEIDVEKYFAIGRDVSPKPDEGGNDMLLDKYDDKDKVSTWAKEAVEWALETKILQGTSETTISPGDVVTREMMCVFMKRLYDKLSYGATFFEDLK